MAKVTKKSRSFNLGIFIKHTYIKGRTNHLLLPFIQCSCVCVHQKTPPKKCMSKLVHTDDLIQERQEISTQMQTWLR